MSDRIIKFRGKRVDNGEWITGYYFKGIDGRSVIMELVDGGDTLADVIVIPESVGQFTGKTDKDGKEIYEGDIVKEVEHETKMTIRWDYTILYHWIYLGHDELKIIGNLQDNKDLIK